jgi:DNA-binding MarR family transcriptional regulator
MKKMRKEREQLATLRHCWHTLMGYFRDRKLTGDYPLLHDLSPQETGAIDLIAETPAIIVRELGLGLQVPKSTLTSILDRLERDGYIQRVISNRDRRSFGLDLTPLGAKVYAQHLAFEATSWEHVLGLLENQDDRERFVSMMGRIAQSLAVKSSTD